MQKYSSNVVEKCLQFANEGGELPNIVLELINDSRFDKIMQDPYGNYAIQTALNNTEVSKAKISLFFFASMFMYDECVKSQDVVKFLCRLVDHSITTECSSACNMFDTFC